MAYGAISESSSVRNAEALVARRAREAQSGLPVFLKNNTRPQPAWQEIVDFLNQPRCAQPGALAAPRERRAISSTEPSIILPRRSTEWPRPGTGLGSAARL